MILDNKLVFCISLKSRANSIDWDTVSRYFENTLKSIQGSSHREFHVVVAGHDKPECIADAPSNVTFLEAPFSSPSTKERGRPSDKTRKRRLAGAWIKNHVKSRVRLAYIDADDIVSKDLVADSLASSPDVSLIVDSGYRLDLSNGNFELLEDGFYKHCGSCLLPVFSVDELPDSWEDDSKVFSKFGPHPQLIERFKELNRPLHKLTKPSVAYLINHPESLEHAKKGLREWLITNQFSQQEKESLVSERFSLSYRSLF